jgi:hypothetical protein
MAPTSMLAECGPSVFSGVDDGNGLPYSEPVESCWLTQVGTFDFNLPLPELHPGYYSFVAVSLPPYGGGTVLGYEVSRCTGTCQLIGVGG